MVDGAELGSKNLDSPHGLTAHRAGRALHDFRSLLDAEILVVSENQHGALPRPEPGERSQQYLPSLEEAFPYIGGALWELLAALMPTPRPLTLTSRPVDQRLVDVRP
jgi:hypothetical protein